MDEKTTTIAPLIVAVRCDNCGATATTDQPAQWRTSHEKCGPSALFVEERAS